MPVEPRWLNDGRSRSKSIRAPDILTSFHYTTLTQVRPRAPPRAHKRPIPTGSTGPCVRSRPVICVPFRPVQPDYAAPKREFSQQQLHNNDLTG